MTNQAAIWYAKEAAKRIGLTEEQTYALTRAMYFEFDIYTEQEADDAYYNRK